MVSERAGPTAQTENDINENEGVPEQPIIDIPSKGKRKKQRYRLLSDI